MEGSLNPPRRPPYRIAGLVLLLVCAAVLGGVYGQFQGAFTTTTRLTVIADRAGLVMEPGAKVTYNGVEIGRVAAITGQQVHGTPKARLRLDIDPVYLDLIPVNVHATVSATTVFGNKYVSSFRRNTPRCNIFHRRM